MFISYMFSPKISVYSRKAAVNSAFNCPLYRRRVAVIYGVFYIVTLCAFAAFFHCYFYSVSAHLAIYIVDFYLCWWPPSFYYYSSTLPAQRWVSTQYYSSFYISYSLSATCRCSTSQLIYLGVLPFWQGLTLYIRFSTQYISFSTGCLCTIVALYITIVSMQMLSRGTTASRFIIICGVRLQTPVILYRY